MNFLNFISNFSALKQVALVFASIICVNMTLGAATWHEDFEKVVSEAKEEDKYMFLYFTGSDWCPPCKVLKDEVFSQPAFKAYAEEDLVLMEMDFDAYGRPRSEDFGRQHYELKQSLGIAGYPMIVLLTSEGDYIETTGFMRGGAEKFVEHIKEIVASVE